MNVKLILKLLGRVELLIAGSSCFLWGCLCSRQKVLSPF